MGQFAIGIASSVVCEIPIKRPFFSAPQRGRCLAQSGNEDEPEVANVEALSLEAGRRIFARHAGLFLFLPLLAQLQFNKLVERADLF